MLIDYHIHTPLCNHAGGLPGQYVQRALELGIREIGFAEHSPWMWQGLYKLAPTYEEIEDYLQEIQWLQKMYNDKGEITIRLGMEMDYLPDRMMVAEEFAQRPELDFIIGSIHTIGKWPSDIFDQPEIFRKLGVRGAFEEYFRRLIDMIRTGLFDVVGHIDIIKVSGKTPELGYADLIQQTAEAIAESGMVVEFNTSGFDRPVADSLPGSEFLRILKAHEIPMTLGSDAHHPLNVGRYFDRAIEILKAAGYTELTTFQKRKRATVPL